MAVVLILPCLQVGYYSYGYKKEKQISLVFKTAQSSQMLSVKLGITFIAYAVLFFSSYCFQKGLAFGKTRLQNCRKEKTGAFIKSWNSLLQLLFWLLVAALMIISLIIICSQNPAVDLS